MALPSSWTLSYNWMGMDSTLDYRSEKKQQASKLITRTFTVPAMLYGDGSIIYLWWEKFKYLPGASSQSCNHPRVDLPSLQERVPQGLLHGDCLPFLSHVMVQWVGWNNDVAETKEEKDKTFHYLHLFKIHKLWHCHWIYLFMTDKFERNTKWTDERPLIVIILQHVSWNKKWCY